MLMEIATLLRNLRGSALLMLISLALVRSFNLARYSAHPVKKFNHISKISVVSSRSRVCMMSEKGPFDGIMRGLGIRKSDAPSSIQDAAPSLEDLKQRLYDQQTPGEREYFTVRESGRGNADSSASIRLFDAPDGTVPRVTLYRDMAAWCPYCQKVWLQLEEKRIPYMVKKVPLRCYGDKPQWFRQLNPSGMLPVAEIDGKLITESNDIMQALEDQFPDHNPLIPRVSSPEGANMSGLLRLERELFSVWFRWLTSPLRDESQRIQFNAVMDRVNSALKESSGPYFLGEQLTIVDIMYTPFLERMAASLPYFKALEVRNNPQWPAVEAWFQAMDSRPSYQGIKSDYYTHCHDLPPQIGGCFSVEAAKPYAAEIDGTDGSWNLPLREGIEPVGQMTSEEARREAASRLLHNFEDVVKFSTRAVGKPGFPPVMADLADPNAQPDNRYVDQVSIALRHIIGVLLAQQEESLIEAMQISGSSMEGCNKAELTACLEYLRDRVGVPRDMSFAAAKQLRAHLNCLIQSL
mmetsp:Transcript_28528/g.37323  ORF Transcript_28528/g.37323 Transcript_28528/m.37323 type:complete len:522 (-) Transcript_28528:303-1868(-)